MSKIFSKTLEQNIQLILPKYLTETLPEEATFVSSSVIPTDRSDNVLTFDLGDLSDGATTSVDIVVTAPATAGNFESEALLSSNTFDPDITNDVDVAGIVVEEAALALPDLEIVRTDVSETVSLGEDYSYTLTVTNNGLGNATGVVLAESLPSANVVSADIVANPTDTDADISSNFVDIFEFQLDAGDRVTIDIDAEEFGSGLDSNLRLFDSEGNSIAESDDNAAPGEFGSLDSYIEFTATSNDLYYVGVSDLSFDYDPLVEDGNTFGTRSGEYDLEISIGDNTTVNQGTISEPNNTIAEATNSGLNSSNGGIFRASGFIESDNDSFDFVDIFNGTISADLGNLNPGESTAVNVVANSFVAGDFNSTTEVTSNETDSNSNNNSILNSITVNSSTPASADLELAQIVDNLNPQIGDEVTFTLTVTNSGPGIASGIEVTDLLPEQFSFLFATPEQGTYDEISGIWDVGNIRDNLSRSLTITALVESSGSTTNVAEITSVNEADPDSVANNNVNSEDDIATANFNIIDPDGVELSIDGGSIVEGNNELIFTVTLSEASDVPLLIDYLTEDGNAIGGEDYVAANGTLEFAPGETEKTISVEVLNDDRFEPDESFSISLSNTNGVNFTSNEAVGIITNNEVDALTLTDDSSLLANLDSSDDSYIYQNETYFYDFFALPVDSSIDAGDIVNVTLASEDFDSVLMILDSAGNAIDFNDNSTEGSTNSELTFQIGSQESFFVSVETKAANQTGDYNLTVDTINVNSSNLEDRFLTPIDSIQTIDTVTGSLTNTDLESPREVFEDDGSISTFNVFEDSYLIKDIEVGQEIKVSLSSDIFDSELDILQIDSTGNIQSILDDTNAVLGISTTETTTFVVEADANYLISVTAGSNSADAIKVGEYNLTSELI